MQWAHRVLDSMYLPGLIAAVCSVVLYCRYAKAREPGAREMVCGQCGYNIHLAPTHDCPECGSDLRRVGIQPKGGANSMPPKELRAYAIFSGVAAVAFVVAQACLDWLV